MTRVWLAAAGLGGLLSVAAGAVAAHLAVGDAHAASLLHTGALYGMVHAAVLVAVAGIAERRGPPGLPLTVAGWSFVAGIALFSVSLFALAWTEITWFGLVTPFGGAALLIGWMALGSDALRPR
jgi:uncharacterized membrane protein YgdD (TMEM256/DUF423 family)